MSENKVINDFVERYTTIKNTYPNLYNSPHEAIAFILKEYRELEKEIFTKEIDKEKIYNESISLASAVFALAIYIDRKKNKEGKNDKTI